jgi:cutinase
MMNAVKGLSANVKKKVAGVVLFGYTKNAQTKSGIPTYPKDNVAVYCSKSDGVCGGALAVTLGHFSYMGDGSGPKAVAFLLSKINSSGASSGGGDGDAPADDGGAAEAPPTKGKGRGKGKFGKGKGGKFGKGRMI